MPWTPLDGVTVGYDEIKASNKYVFGYNYFNEDVRRLMQEFQHLYLTHVNPYTGYAYRDEPAIVGMLITNENDYQRQQAAAAQQAAGRLGVDLDILFAGNDAIQQSQQLLDVIQSHKSQINGILVEPAGRTAFPKVAQAAVASGVAWVVMNCDADYLRDVRAGSNVPVFAVRQDMLSRNWSASNLNGSSTWNCWRRTAEECG